MNTPSDGDVYPVIQGLQSLPHIDSRTEEEILTLLSRPSPVTSEKNVWAFWDRGVTNLHSWTKRNIITWVRILGSQWTVRVLDRVEGSASNVHNFVEEEFFPECFNRHTMSGPHAGQHSSDLVRLPCLYKYGGVYMDVGIVLLRHLDDICWNTITDSSSSIELVFPSLDFTLNSAKIGNFFFAAQKGNEFILRWMKVFLEVWKTKSSGEGTQLHPLLSHLLQIGSNAPMLRAMPLHEIDYFSQTLSLDRVRLLRDADDGFDGHKYFEDHVALLEYLECDAATVLSHKDGEKAMRFLKMQRTPSHNQPDFRSAKKFTERLLTNTAMLKMYHWSELETPTLAQLWDLTENENADNEPGSFGEWLRWSSWHYSQRRALKAVNFPKLDETVVTASLLQPIETV